MTTSHDAGRRNADLALEQATARRRPTVPERAGLLVSIQPFYAKAILEGDKTVELRRRAPKSHPPLAVIYGSGTDRAVLGTAHIDAIHTATPAEIWRTFGAVSGITRDAFDAYFAGCIEASALALVSPERATQPMPLSELRALGLEPPQSWRYVNASQVEALLSSMHPERRTDKAARLTTGPMDWASQGVKSLAAFALCCVSIGRSQRARPSDPISLGTLAHTMPAPRCYSAPNPRRARANEDL